MLEKLYSMPQMVRVESEHEGEGGYEYPEKYQHKAFLIEDKLIIFEKRKYIEFPIVLVNTILDISSKMFLPLEELENLNNNLNENIDEIKKELSNLDESRFVNIETKLMSINDLITNLSDKIMSVSESSNKLEDLTADVNKYTQKLVSNELDNIYKNFESGIKALVKQEVENIKSEIVKNENKLKPAQIMVYKEMGLSLSEIIELKTSGLL